MITSVAVVFSQLFWCQTVEAAGIVTYCPQRLTLRTSGFSLIVEALHSLLIIKRDLEHA